MQGGRPEHVIRSLLFILSFRACVLALLDKNSFVSGPVRADAQYEVRVANPESALKVSSKQKGGRTG